MTWSKGNEILEPCDEQNKKPVPNAITPTFFITYPTLLVDGTALQYKFFSQVAILSILDPTAGAYALANKMMDWLESVLNAKDGPTRILLAFDSPKPNPDKEEERKRRELSNPPLTAAAITALIQPLAGCDLNDPNYEDQRQQIEKKLSARASPRMITKLVMYLTAKRIANYEAGKMVQIVAAGEAEATLALLERQVKGAAILSDDGDVASFGGNVQITDLHVQKGKLKGTWRKNNDAFKSLTFKCLAGKEPGIMCKFNPHQLVVASVIHTAAGGDFFQVGRGSEKSARGVTGMGNITALNCLLQLSSDIAACESASHALELCCGCIFASNSWHAAVEKLSLRERLEATKSFRRACSIFFLGAASSFQCTRAVSKPLLDQIFMCRAYVSIAHVNPSPSKPDDKSLNQPTGSTREQFRIIVGDKSKETYCCDILIDTNFTNKFPSNYFRFMDFLEWTGEKQETVYRVGDISLLKSIAVLFGVQVQPKISRAQLVGIIRMRVKSKIIPTNKFDRGRLFHRPVNAPHSLVADGIGGNNDVKSVLEWINDTDFGRSDSGKKHHIFHRATVPDSTSTTLLPVTEAQRAIKLVFGHISIKHIRVYETTNDDEHRVIISITNVLGSYSKNMYEVHLVFNVPLDELKCDSPFYLSNESVCSCVAGQGKCSHKAAALLFIGLLIASTEYAVTNEQIVERLPAQVVQKMKEVHMVNDAFHECSESESSENDDESSGSDGESSGNDGEGVLSDSDAEELESGQEENLGSDVNGDGDGSQTPDVRENENDDGLVSGSDSSDENESAFVPFAPRESTREDEKSYQLYYGGNLLHKIEEIVWQAKALAGFPQMRHASDVKGTVKWDLNVRAVNERKELQAKARNFFELLTVTGAVQ